MHLGQLAELSYGELRVAVRRTLTEGPMGAPRWDFGYDNWQQDPTPDALILGTYQHPTSGNELVGGINLHYLEKAQIVELQKVLPRIMRGTDLKQRYDIGTRVLPQIFNNYYRTYRSDYVNGVTPTQLPYWYDKKTRAAKIQKSQRQKDMERTAAARRQQELRRQALQAMQTQRPLDSPPPLAARPPIPAPTSTAPPGGPRIPGSPPGRPVAPDSVDALQTQQRQGEAELQQLANMQRQRAQQLAQVKQRHDVARAKADAQKKLERERRQNLHQLEVPSPEQAAEGDPLAVGESITYWCPTRRRYLTEPYY